MIQLPMIKLSKKTIITTQMSVTSSNSFAIREYGNLIYGRFLEITIIYLYGHISQLGTRWSARRYRSGQILSGILTYFLNLICFPASMTFWTRWCSWSFITIHISGEVVSRASRSRRMQAIDASTDAEGYHLDWIFTVYICYFLLLVLDRCNDYWHSCT